MKQKCLVGIKSIGVYGDVVYKVIFLKLNVILSVNFRTYYVIMK